MSSANRVTSRKQPAKTKVEGAFERSLESLIKAFKKSFNGSLKGLIKAFTRFLKDL